MFVSTAGPTASVDEDGGETRTSTVPSSATASADEGGADSEAAMPLSAPCVAAEQKPEYFLCDWCHVFVWHEKIRVNAAMTDEFKLLERNYSIETHDRPMNLNGW